MELDTYPVCEERRSREIELKLELEPGGDRLLAKHPLLSDRLGEERQTVSTYFDTESGDLRRAGLTLRVRRSGADYLQTVKASPRGSAGLFDRWEWEEPIDGPEPRVDRIPAVAGRRLPGIRHELLRPLFTTRVGRRSCVIETGDGQVEVVVDRGEVIAGSERQKLLELELELVSGSPRALFDLARTFQADVPLSIGVLSKSERGRRLASGKAGRASKAEPVALNREMKALDAFPAIALACIRHFSADEPLLVATREADALHQCRVALRRLRSALSLFRSVLRGRERRRFQDSLRSLAGTLGEARNLDVLLARHGERMGPSAREALSGHRSRVYDRAIEELRSPPVRRMMIDLAEWVALGAPDGAGKRAGVQAIGPFSADVLDHYWKKVKRRGKALASMDDEARHELRIAAKKLRYAGEFFASLYAGRRQQDDFLAEMATLQEQLGDLNDLATERALQGELAQHGIDLPPLRHECGEGKFRAKRLASAEAAVARLVEIGPFWRERG